MSRRPDPSGDWLRSGVEAPASTLDDLLDAPLLAAAALSPADGAALLDTLADGLAAGTTAAQVLAAVPTEPGTLADATVSDLRVRLRAGSRLSEALAAYPRTFPYAAAAAALGEATGRLPAGLRSAAADIRDEQTLLRRAARGGAGAAAIAAGLLTLTAVTAAAVLPLAVHAGAAPLAVTLLQIARWAPLLAIVPLLAAAVVRVLSRLTSPAAGRQAERLRMRLPGVGPLLRSLALARVARVLGDALSAGVSSAAALRLAAATAGGLAGPLQTAALLADGGTGCVDALAADKDLATLHAAAAPASVCGNVPAALHAYAETQRAAALDPTRRLGGAAPLAVTGGAVAVVVWLALLVGPLLMSR